MEKYLPRKKTVPFLQEVGIMSESIVNSIAKLIINPTDFTQRDIIMSL